MAMELEDDSPLMRGRGRPPVDTIEQMQAHQERVVLSEYFESLISTKGARIKVSRLAPAMWKGRNIAGYIDSYDYPISEQEIKDLYGGGRYGLQAFGPDNKKRDKQIVVEISGDPILRTEEATNPAMIGDGSNAAAIVAGQASSTNELIVKQLEHAQRANEQLQRRFEEMQVKMLTPREDPGQTRILEFVSQNSSTQISMLMSQHASELQSERAARATLEDRMRRDYETDKRMFQESHARELSMVRETLTRENDAIKQSLLREIDQMKTIHTAQHERLMTVQETIKELKDAEIARLRMQLEGQQRELETLRSQKTQTLQEKARELREVRESLGIDDNKSGGDDEGQGGLMGTLGKIFESDVAKTVAARLLTGLSEQPGAAAPAPPQMALPPAMPVSAPQPQRRVRTPTTQGVAPMASMPQAPLPKPPAPQPTQAAPTQAPMAPVQAPTPQAGPSATRSPEVELAIELAVQGFQNNQNPAEFAATVKPMVPETIIDEIRRRGVDEFLHAHGHSGLFPTQAAKNWIRKVGAALTA